ncbi:MAG: hypothetical protein M3T56_03245 [Chloroflexota bacterium]|nr:hypothetical protein [Chloroflexota bacterium]
MRLELSERIVRVVLSRRNLRALMAKLDGSPPVSACTISYDTRDGVTLFVTAEEDAPHYQNPERDVPAPGPMHPDTEERLRG